MAYISVNGYDFPPPKRGAKPTVSTMVDAGRNANGTVVGRGLVGISTNSTPSNGRGLQQQNGAGCLRC